jgi:hypothetical protein
VPPVRVDGREAEIAPSFPVGRATKLRSVVEPDDRLRAQRVPPRSLAAAARQRGAQRTAPTRASALGCRRQRRRRRARRPVEGGAAVRGHVEQLPGGQRRTRAQHASGVRPPAPAYGRVLLRREVGAPAPHTVPIAADGRLVFADLHLRKLADNSFTLAIQAAPNAPRNVHVSAICLDCLAGNTPPSE